MDSIIGNSRRPDLTFYRSGRIDITSHVARAIGLQDGDVIDIGRQGKEFYLYVRIKKEKAIGKHLGQCHSSKPNSHNFRTYSKAICHSLLGDTYGERLCLSVGHPEDIEGIGIAIPIITRQIL